MRPRTLHVCATPGCPNLTAHRLCDGCEAKRQRGVDDRRPTARARGYGGAWPRRRAAFLRRNPICEDCGRPATEADHDPSRERLVAMGVRDPDADQYLHPRCKRCHSRKTVQRDGGFGRPKRPA